MNASLDDQLRLEAARISQIKDAQERVRTVNDLFAALDEHVARISDIRDAALVELHADQGYDRLAVLSGLSKSRVAQIVRRAGRR